MDITDDSSMIVGGFADSTVRVWSVTPKKLRSVKAAAGNYNQNTWNEHVLFVMPVFSVNRERHLCQESCFQQLDVVNLKKQYVHRCVIASYVLPLEIASYENYEIASMYYHNVLPLEMYIFLKVWEIWVCTPAAR